MPVSDIFSKRHKKLRGEVPDVFQYHLLPPEFRVQVVHILRDALGESTDYREESEKAFEAISSLLCREYGLFSLVEGVSTSHAVVFNFFLQTDSIDRALDVIEVSFKLVDTLARDHYKHRRLEAKIEPDEAIDELNHRFLEHGIGYQFESGQVIRIDSGIIHTEVVKPVLTLLRAKPFEGANEEFLSAHSHYRHADHRACLADCLNALESTLKAICTERGWAFDKADTAKRLLDICFENGLTPSFMQLHFAALRSSLESGVPTLRNRLAGHGQGSEPVEVPQYIAHYALNLTATAILFLCEAYSATK